MPVDYHIKQMMRDLRHALAQAIASSAKVGHAVRKIQQEGYSLYLVLDRKEEGDREAQIELTTGQPDSKEAVFVLDKGDVSLLRSLGIDATRTGKRRRAP